MATDERGDAPQLDRQPDDDRLQARCGVCGAALHPGRDDLYAELCRCCERSGLKNRQARPRPQRRSERIP